MGTRLQRHSGARFFSWNNWIGIYWFFINFQFPAGDNHLLNHWDPSLLPLPPASWFLHQLNFFEPQSIFFYVLRGSLLLFWDIINLCSNNFSYFRKNNVAHFSFSLLATLLCHVYYQEEGDKCFFFVSLITTMKSKLKDEKFKSRNRCEGGAEPALELREWKLGRDTVSSSGQICLLIVFVRNHFFLVLFGPSVFTINLNRDLNQRDSNSLGERSPRIARRF